MGFPKSSHTNIRTTFEGALAVRAKKTGETVFDDDGLIHAEFLGADLEFVVSKIVGKQRDRYSSDDIRKAMAFMLERNPFSVEYFAIGLGRKTEEEWGQEAEVQDQNMGILLDAILKKDFESAYRKYQEIRTDYQTRGVAQILINEIERIERADYIDRSSELIAIEKAVSLFERWACISGFRLGYFFSLGRPPYLDWPRSGNHRSTSRNL